MIGNIHLTTTNLLFDKKYILFLQNHKKIKYKTLNKITLT